MPDESKRTTILNYLRDTTLAAITTGNGYNFTVGNIARGIQAMDVLAVSKFPCLWIVKADEDRENITINQIRSNMTVVIVGYVRNSSGTNGLQEDLDKLIQDTSRALEQDRLLNGSSYRLRIRSIHTDEGDIDPIAAFAMEVDISYASEGVSV